MSISKMERIPLRRREFVLDEIRTLINEHDAANRSLESIDEQCRADDVLADIIIRLNGEIRRSKKRHKILTLEPMRIGA